MGFSNRNFVWCDGIMCIRGENFNSGIFLQDSKEGGLLHPRGFEILGMLGFVGRETYELRMTSHEIFVGNEIALSVWVSKVERRERGISWSLEHVQ